MLISVLINNYNYAHFLGDAIDSVLAQLPADCELIVVDDGSTDNSRDILRAYDGRVTSILQKNAGQAAAFNAGFVAANGGLVFLLDADDTFAPNKISRMLSIYEERPEIDWCFHDVAMVGDVASAPVESQRSRVIDQRVALRLGRPTVKFPATSALTFRRSLLDRLLPMETGAGVSIGDHYLKFGAAGLAPGFHLGEPLSLQRVHASNHYTATRHEALEASIYIKTAGALRRKIPPISAFCDNLAGTATLLNGLEPAQRTSQEIRDYIAGGSALTKLRMRIFASMKRRSVMQKRIRHD